MTFHFRWTGRAAAFFAPFAAALLVGGVSSAGTLVAPDGRTQTQLSVSGGTTDVTTSTIHGGNAFNSFSQFQVGQGDTVNLHVPDSAQRLLNVIHNAPVNIDGTVNGYQNGKIGGNVYFADPYGFVVGKTGSVNVGSLTVRTPTSAATEKLIDSQGNIDDPTVTSLLDGSIPISPDGSVVIRGRINAPNGVSISAQRVTTAPDPNDSTVFDASVNTKGLQRGGRIVVVNGNIEILAAGDATIGGTLLANGAPGRGAGNVTITTGGNTHITSRALISAKGRGQSSNGGHVKVLAQQNLNVDSGAAVNVSGGDSGDGGSIEFSAKGTAYIAGASLNTGATQGKAGSVVIDPTDVVIGPQSDVDVGGSQASIDSNGGSVTITASNSITLEPSAYINTRQTVVSGSPTANDTSSNSVGNSGDVDLTAPNITIAGSINAFAINTASTHYLDGNITLTASPPPDDEEFGLAKANAAIDISGTLHGGVIDVEANATASSAPSVLDDIENGLISSILGVGAGYVDGQATATINVDGTAHIRGSGDVTLNAWSNATANIAMDTLLALSGTPAVPSVLVGNVTSKTTADVASGAFVHSGGALTVRAHSIDDLNVTNVTVTGAVAIDAAVAYTTADIESNANVAEGADISAQSANITARNSNSFNTAVTVVALGTGSVGLTAAIADGYRSEADAHFGPSLDLTGPASGQDLTVEADSLTAKDAVSASTTVGSNLIIRFVTSPVADALSGVEGKFSDAMSAAFGSLSLIKLGAAISLTLDNEQSAKATLGGDATNAPTINANQVAVVANTLEAGVRSNANSATNSPNVSDATPANPTAEFSVSAGVAVSERDLTADAEIGSGASVTAPNIGVSSDVALPVTITWLDFDSFTDVISHINGNLGVVNDVLTSFTDSTADAGVGGIAGSVNLFNVNANSTAFVGQGATLSSTGAAAGPWSVALDSDDDANHGLGGSRMAQFDQPVAIAAARDIESINFGGNFSIFANGVGGAADDAAVFGATYESINYSGSTDAGIGADATVSSDQGLSVEASASDKAIDVSPAAGRGGGVGFSGMVALFDLDTDTHASIASTADVSAALITVSADQIENVGSVAGSLIVGNSNSIGAMETTNTIDTNIQAYVGDNSADDPTQASDLIPSFAAPTAGLTATGGTITLAATESGLVQSLAVSVDAGSNAAIGAAVAVDNINDNIGAVLGDSALVNAKDVYVNASADDTIHTIAMGASATGGSGVAIAGSAATSMISPTVLASVNGSSAVTADDNVGIIASNNDEIDVVAGAAGVGDGPAGIGVSVVVNQISGSTTASITGADTSVDANGADATDTFQVNNGTLVSTPDTSSIVAPSDTVPSLAENQDTIAGLGLISTSHQGVAADAATVGVGNGTGDAVIAVTTIIGASSDAYVQDASVDTNLTGNPLDGDNAPALEIVASNQTYTGDFVAALALSNNFAGAAGASTVKFDDSDKAYVQDADVGTVGLNNLLVMGPATITAGSTQAAATIILGGSAGSSGAGAASLGIALFSADTEADVSGGSVQAGSLDVNATSDNGANLLVGAAAIGGVGVGGSVAVTINDDTTLAYLGDRADELDVGTIDPTTLNVGALSAAATTDNHLHSLVIAGAGGYTAGIAAMADVTLLSSTTDAGIYAATINASPFPKAGDITINATESDSIDATAGGGAAGGVGVGIAANVAVLHSSVTGTILDSDIRSTGDVGVSASGTKDIDAQTITGAVGYFAGVGAAVGVVLAGTDASSDVSDQVNQNGGGTLSNVDQQAPGNNIAGAVNSGSPDAVTASMAGGSLSAASLSIMATGTVSTSNQAVGVAAGGAAGVGGAVAYTDVGDTVIASLDSTDPVVPVITLSAQMLDGSGHAVSTEADAGGGGAVGIGAGVAIGKLSDTVAAQMGGDASGDNSGGLSILASDSGSISSTAAGGAAGGVAVGVMVATAAKDSTVSADMLVGTISDYQTIALMATGSGSVSSSSTGVSGGVLDAGNAAAATADDNETIGARLGDNVIITGASGLTSLSAGDTPDLSADAYGVAVSGGVALGVSVALANIDPTVMATVGDGVSVSGNGGFSLTATLAPVSGQTAASSSAFAGAGGIELALNGAVAITSNASDVEATTGDSLVLPDGDVGILASNTSNQDAYASGVGVGGIAGGASDAESNTNSTTKAVLGTNAMGGTHMGALSIQALGNDTDTSHSVAGTYGLVAGNASFARTRDKADVEATIGADTSLPASSVTLSAAHQDNYAEFADSTEVSVLGASGAGASHSADVTVTATVGHDVALIAGDSIDISAENDFMRTGTDDAADAGGGGVFNGAGATSDTEITGASDVMIADDATLTAGNDPVSNPGHINIVADSTVEANDIVSLSTGGALEGAGVSNDFNATVNNDVSLGQDDTFLSFGNFNAGTYTTASVTVEALGSTWGILGAVANADADLSLVSNQSVELGQGSSIQVYGNANLTAGQNPADIQDSEMQGGAEAETYVRGFIAIPDAHAHSDITNNTSLTLASGSIVNAGENAILGSFTGQITPTADGTGHGYELGFIPVTDGGQSATPHASSTAEIDGAVTAGAFNNITVTIPDCADEGVYCDQISASGQLSAANLLSPLGAYLHNFLPVNYINQHTTGADAQFLADGVSSIAVDAVALNTLFASPGNVTVHADTLTGTGSLTANGSASITVTNDSPDYLTLANIQIPNIPGGNVYFTGQADATAAPGITVTQNDPGAASAITVTDTFNGPVGNTALGPAIFVGGGIQNLGGSVGITDPSGSLGQFAPIIAQDVVINVPAGSLLVDLAPNELYTSGASVQADWAPFMIFPGGNPGSVTPSPDLAVAYAVNAVFRTTQTTNYDFNTSLDARGDDALGAQGSSYVVYGTCLPTNASGSDNCGIGTSQPFSPDNAVWDLGYFDGFHSGSRGIAEVPIEPLFTFSYNNITPANETTQASALTANKISINATYIDIDSDISAGPPTNWSVSLPGSLAQTIANDQAAYQNGSVSNPNFALPGVSVIGAADSLIKVTYVAGATAADGRIVVDNVLASAQVAASIKLDGGIISTNALGHIHVNAGLGQVNIDNETGTALTVNNVSAGNAERLGGLSGTVEIVDTLKTSGTDHIWYVYTPGTGTSYYTSSDPNATLAQATLASADGTTSFTYDPAPGLRWQWQQTAFLSRTVTLNPTNSQVNPRSTFWGFDDPNGNSLGLGATKVWYYLDTVDPSSAVAGSNGQLFNYNGQVLTTDPAHSGTLVTGSYELPYMLETITGTVGFTQVQAVDYDCIQKMSVSCGTQAQGSYAGFVSSQDWWDYDYITQGTVTMMTSVKADNPIAIDFSGSGRGSVNIASNAPVTFNGQITNPDGDTSLTSTGGGLVTTANGSVLSNNLTLTASGAVGTSSNLFNITQTHDGTLNAAANGVYLASTSALNISTVSGGTGDVVLNASGNINGVGVASPATITGDNLTLVASHGGGIGTAAPLTTAITGTLNAKADGVIAIEQTQGNLLAGNIVSTGGGAAHTVNVTVDNGALKDANNTTATEALSDTQQQAIWKTLKLTVQYGGAVNSTAGSVTVAAVSNTIGTDYQQYWLLLDHGSVQGGVFTLDPGSVALFQPIAAQAGLSAQDYAAGLYSKVAGDFNQYVGSDWASQAAFPSQVSNFSFTPPQSEIDKLTNNGDAVWTEGELKSALALTALQPSANTTLGTATPNVAGGTLNLEASNGIGSLADPVHITLADLESGNLTPDQQTAIALAKNPGDILFSGVDAEGHSVQFSGTVTPAGVMVTGVDIKQTAPLFVSGATVNASTPQGGIFLQAASGDLNLGLINANGGLVSLAAPNNILAAAPGSAAVILGGDISLLAGAGDIGSAITPLVYAGNSIASASAGGNIYLTAQGSDMRVGRIFAGGDVVLSAPGGGIQPLLAGITLDAANLVLDAGAGDIGSATQAFEVRLASGGTLGGSASGAAWLAGAGDLDFSGFSADGMSVTATGNLTVADVASGGNLNAAAGGNADFADVQVANNADLTAVGNLAADDVSSGGTMAAAAGGNAAFTNVEADGDATLAASGDLNADGVSAGGTMTVSAKNVSLGGLQSDGAMTVTVINNAAVTSNGALQSGAGFAMNAGGSLTMGADSLISAVKQLSLAIGGDAVLGRIESLFGGDHAIALAAHSITGNGYGQANIVAQASGAKTYLSAQTGIGAPSRFLIVNTPWIDPTTVSGGIYLSALSDMTIPDLVVPADFSVTGAGNLTLGSLTAGGNVAIIATDNLSFTDMIAGGDVSLGGNNLNLGDLNVSGNVTLAAANNIAFTDIDIAAAKAFLSAGNAISGDSLTAAGTATLSAGLGSIQVAHLSAVALVLRSLGDLDLADIRAGESLSITAPNVIAKIMQTGSGPLAMDIQGASGGSVQNANLTIDAPNGIDFGVYSVSNGAITTNATMVDIAKGHVDAKLFLITPATDLYMNDRSPTPIRGVTGQFFTPGKDFFLRQNGTETVTNSFLIDFGPGISVTTIDSHGNATTGLALVRTAPLPLSAASWTKIFAQQTAGDPAGMVLPDPWNGTAPNLAVFENWVASAEAGAAVNTGAPTD